MHKHLPSAPSEPTGRSAPSGLTCRGPRLTATRESGRVALGFTRLHGPLRPSVAILVALQLAACAGVGIVTDRPYEPLPPGMSARKDKDRKMTFKVPQGWKEDDPKAIVPGVSGTIEWIAFAMTRTSDVLAFRKGNKGAFALWCDNSTGTTHWSERLDNRVKVEAPLSVQAEAIHIETKANVTKSFLFRFDSEVVRDGQKVKAPFTLYNGRKEAAFLNLSGCEYMFYGKVISNEHGPEIEGDFVAVLRSIEAP